jgi:uncharacterized protein YndB with AHSA1/START domain
MRSVRESIVIRAPRERVFRIAATEDSLPRFFRGALGLIPSIESMKTESPVREGALREVVLGDGSRIVERVTAWDPPRFHAYEAHEKNPLQALLFAKLSASFAFEEEGEGTRVTWTYSLVPRTPFLLPVVALVLFAFRKAQRRCLEAIKSELETSD